VAELAAAISPSPAIHAESLKRIAILPALNEAAAIGRVIADIRAYDPGFEIVVVDDGSTDATAAVARSLGVTVLTLPFNLGIGGAVQTGYRYALENGFKVAVQVDADGQHDASQLGALLEPLIAHRADMVIGSRFIRNRTYSAGVARGLGIRLFAAVMSVLLRRRVTDTTSGFRAINRRAIRLFAAEYPHDYPEVEAMLMAARERLRVEEVPVTMQPRRTGRSSITGPRSLYYMVKVLLAVLVGLARKRTNSTEDE
jgi:glycosyltransferase involved in cell wall biosynthesis